jgi:hypothetical protein
VLSKLVASTASREIDGPEMLLTSATVVKLNGDVGLPILNAAPKPIFPAVAISASYSS